MQARRLRVVVPQNVNAGLAEVDHPLGVNVDAMPEPEGPHTPGKSAPPAARWDPEEEPAGTPLSGASSLPIEFYFVQCPKQKSLMETRRFSYSTGNERFVERKCARPAEPTLSVACTAVKDLIVPSSICEKIGQTTSLSITRLGPSEVRSSSGRLGYRVRL